MIRSLKGPWLVAAALFFLTPLTTSAQLSFVTMEPLTNREARVRLTVPAGTLARLDTSTNLIDWNAFLTAGPGALVRTDTFAPFLPARFYRAAQAPAGTMTGDHIPAESGDIVIHPVTHASFVMTWNGVTIYNDPDTATYTGLPKASLTLVSHDHGDHFDAATITATRAANGLIIAPRAVYNVLPAALKPSAIILTNGASTNVLGIEILAVPAWNSNHAKGTGNGYVLTIGGKRFYMSGDTGDVPEIRALREIDVAFVCINIPFTLTVPQAVAVVRAFAPRMVYPYHFRNQDGSYANLNSFKTLVGTDLGIEVRLRKWY